VTNVARNLTRLVENATIVDGEGNEIKRPQDVSRDAFILTRLPDAFIKALPAEWQEVAETAMSRIQIPMASLDVVMQAEPFNPGFGPFAVLPAYGILKKRPEFEDAFAEMFPVGMPNSASDIFVPAAVRRLKSMWTEDDAYVRTFNQMMTYEAYKFNQGLRDDVPESSEIADMTNKFFTLRAISSLTMPFAISPETDFYRQKFRQFRDQYGQEAEAKFLEQFPEFFEATISLSKNTGGVEASIGTVQNLKKHRDLMAMAAAQGESDLIGFLADDGDGKYTFSEAAYKWQSENGAFPGSKDSYRRNRNAAEVQREANLKRGWTEFRKVMDKIDAYKIQNGITDDKDPRVKALNDVKTQWARAMGEQNPQWFAEYMSPDRGKYMRRAEVLKEALSNKKWMNQFGDRPVVRSMAVYLDARDKVAEILDARRKAGGAYTLSANANEDIAAVWSAFVTQLKAESPEFADFINRYFTNDTVVV
jgi:hypothetical protein